MAGLDPPPSAGVDAEKRAAADRVIKTYVLRAVGIGLVPFPVVDVVGVTALELNMLSDLAEIYEAPFPHRLAAAKVLVSLIGSIGSIYLVARLGALVKVTPLVGHALHLGLFPIADGGSVYAVGKLFQEHHESGGALLGKDGALLREIFRVRYAEGQRVALAWGKQASR